LLLKKFLFFAWKQHLVITINVVYAFELFYFILGDYDDEQVNYKNDLDNQEWTVTKVKIVVSAHLLRIQLFSVCIFMTLERSLFFSRWDFSIRERSRPFKTFSYWEEDKTITKESQKKVTKHFFISALQVFYFIIFLYFIILRERQNFTPKRSEKREVNYSNFKLCEIHSNECIWMESFSTLHKVLN
jgi:hypothetical protein